MVLNIFVAIFVLGITFIHSIFGLFSGLIDVFCALVAMVVAFGCTDALNELITAQGVHPAYSLPVCFVLLFALTHIILRVLADNLIRGNVRVPRQLDWIGGAVCGFIIAEITVGVVVLGFLMLPWGGRVMMFSRYERTDNVNPDTGRVEFKRNSIWFKPDEFAVGLFKLISGGSLKYHTSFASIYPDFSEWIFWSGNTVQQESNPSPYNDDQGKGFGAGGLNVVTWWEPKGPVEGEYRRRLPTQQNAEPGIEPMTYKLAAGRDTHLVALRVLLKQGAADRSGGSAYHRFRPSMFRLVGDVHGEPREYIAQILGGAAQGADILRIADVDHNFVLPAGSGTPVDVYFEVDRGFVPRFVEYRRFARATVAGPPAAAAPDEKLLAENIQTGANQPPLLDAMRFVDAIIPEGTGDRTELPIRMSLSALRSADVELKDGKFQSGRIAGPVSRFAAAGPVGTVSEFALPEGYRLFQFECHPRRAESLAGHVFNFVGSVVNQYRAIDDQAGVWPLVGYYAIVKRSGEDFIELFLVSEENQPAFRGMLDFQSIRNSELRNSDSVLGLLFFVRPAPQLHIGRVQTQRNQAVLFTIPGYPIGGD